MTKVFLETNKNVGLFSALDKQLLEFILLLNFPNIKCHYVKNIYVDDVCFSSSECFLIIMFMAVLLK